ncbi:hypothetical protein AB6A40_010826 [Gnathostoma spinigerum]|uniref:Uncharacterized protein n=1 Tax=Gnathostoma spinigerum TaxID=75299 RepID=A0ABD6EYF7_9BILA
MEDIMDQLADCLVAPYAFALISNGTGKAFRFSSMPMIRCYKQPKPWGIFLKLQCCLKYFYYTAVIPNEHTSNTLQNWCGRSDLHPLQNEQPQRLSILFHLANGS